MGKLKRPARRAAERLRGWLGLVAAVQTVCVVGAIANLGPVVAVYAAQVAPASEYELKATFVFNFIKFTEWPGNNSGKSDEPFVIGIVGKDPFGAALDKVIEGETIHNRKIVVRRFPRMDDAAANSHILFISVSEERNLDAILKLLDGQAVLTVSDIARFAERGGVVELKKDGNRIVFEINLSSAKRGGLNMNAQLLKLAKAVRRRS